MLHVGWLMLEFAEDTVHRPVDGCGRYAGTGADADALQMFDDVLDDRILHVRRIGHGDFLIALARLQADGLVVEYREAHEALGADDLYAVFAGTLMGHIAPRAAARQTVLESEAGTHGILGLVVFTTIATDASGFENHAEHVLQQVELVWGHIVEIATARNLRMQSPSQFTARTDGLSIGGAKRFGIAHLDIDNLSYSATFNYIENLLEIRQIPTIVSYKTRYTRLF